MFSVPTSSLAKSSLAMHLLHMRNRRSSKVCPWAMQNQLVSDEAGKGEHSTTISPHAHGQ